MGIILFLTIVVGISAVSAADGGNIISINNTYSISDTIEHAHDGDAIYLEEGTYSENSIIVNKSLSFVGNGSRDSVVIDGEGKAFHFKIINGVTVSFQNITFVNGYTPYTVSGASIVIAESSAVIDNCRFENNSAGWCGGAVDVAGVSYYKESRLYLTNSIFIGNSASHDGGAVTTYYGRTTIENCEFYNNTAGRDGGAVRVKFTQYHMIDNCTFMYNRARGGNGWGGAIYTWSDVDSYIKNSYFAYNFADEAGGAITSASRLVVTNCTIVNNSARYMGGGIYIFEEGEEVYSTAVFNYNSIYGNEITLPQYFLSQGNDVYIHKIVTPGNVLNFNDNYWGVNDPITATSYPFTWEERFYTSNRTENPTSWINILENSKLVGENISMYYLNGSNYSVKLIDSNGIVMVNEVLTISINGENYTRRTNVNGTAFMNIRLDPGIYSLSVTFKGNENYYGTALNNTVEVLPTVEGSDIVKYFKNDTMFSARILNGFGEYVSNRTVEMNVNGVIYKRTSKENGSFSLPINLAPGNYILTVLNPVDGLLRSFNITVLALIQGEDLTKFYRNESRYSIKVFDRQGNVASNQLVYFNINGVIYNRTTSSEGVASLAINLAPGSYIVTAFFNDSAISNTVDVLSVIESKDLEMASDARVPFVVTVLNGQGKPLAGGNLSFNINGMVYDRTSNVNGTASLDINLMAGKYVITTLFNGLFQSNEITIVGGVLS